VKLTLIEGPATVCHCDGCNRDGIGGSEPYASASTAEVRQPETWYRDERGIYCSECSAKLVQEDPTRSRSQFYLDTAGTEIHPDVL
jgi:hypothetical protein